MFVSLRETGKVSREMFKKASEFNSLEAFRFHGDTLAEFPNHVYDDVCLNKWFDCLSQVQATQSQAFWC